MVNVASVPQRSPFRYPGGKTWLVPIIRQWLSQRSAKQAELIEPFAGGGIVGLTAAFEQLVKSVTLIERDEEVAAVWEVLINGDYEALAHRIYHFELTAENANAEFARVDKSIEDIALCTILKNRTYHGGIIAKGSGFLKHGENGKGILSRWYPKTLRDRILAIGQVRSRLNFRTGDAFENISDNLRFRSKYFFIDPPYTIAAKRLYTYFDIDHERLFELTARIQGKYMLTYDDTPEVRGIADKHGMAYVSIPMKTTHHLEKNELLISDNLDWLKK